MAVLGGNAPVPLPGYVTASELALAIGKTDTPRARKPLITH